MFVQPVRNYQPPHDKGVFGARRRYDVHTGVDLYTPEGEPVYAIEAGFVHRVLPFTGPRAGHTWWLDTDAVVVQGASGFALYGEITPCVIEGTFVLPGALLGHVKRVLRNDKGLPTTMLHFELYSRFTESVGWELDADKPEGLEDPTELLKAAGITFGA